MNISPPALVHTASNLLASFSHHSFLTIAGHRPTLTQTYHGWYRPRQLPHSVFLFSRSNHLGTQEIPVNRIPETIIQAITHDNVKAYHHPTPTRYECVSESPSPPLFGSFDRRQTSVKPISIDGSGSSSSVCGCSCGCCGRDGFGIAINSANCTLSGSGESGGELELELEFVVGGRGEEVPDRVVSGTSVVGLCRCRSLLGIHTR